MLMALSSLLETSRMGLHHLINVDVFVKSTRNIKNGFTINVDVMSTRKQGEWVYTTCLMWMKQGLDRPFYECEI